MILTRLRADKFLYAGIIYAGRVDNSAIETKSLRILSRFINLIGHSRFLLVKVFLGPGNVGKFKLKQQCFFINLIIAYFVPISFVGIYKGKRI